MEMYGWGGAFARDLDRIGSSPSGSARQAGGIFQRLCRQKDEVLSRDRESGVISILRQSQALVTKLLRSEDAPDRTSMRLMNTIALHLRETRWTGLLHTLILIA
jgi:hypothetical protein